MRRILSNYTSWNYYGYAYLNGKEVERLSEVDSSVCDFVLAPEPDPMKVAILLPKEDCLVRIECPYHAQSGSFLARYIGSVGVTADKQSLVCYLFLKTKETFGRGRHTFDVYLAETDLELLNLRNEYEKDADYK